VITLSMRVLLFLVLVGGALAVPSFCGAATRTNWVEYILNRVVPSEVCTTQHLETLVESAVECAGYMATKLYLLEAAPLAHPYLAHVEEWGDQDMHWEAPCVFSDRDLWRQFQSLLAQRLGNIKRGLSGNAAYRLADPNAVVVDKAKEEVAPPADEHDNIFSGTLVGTMHLVGEMPSHDLVWNEETNGFSMPNTAMKVSLHWLTEDEKKGTDTVVVLSYVMEGRRIHLDIYA
jgi:hypothetical protein